MNELVKELIQSYIYGSPDRFESSARELLQSDKAAKDKSFCKNMLQRLDDMKVERFKVPSSLTGLVSYVDLRRTFPIDRYYLTAENKELFEAICLKRKVCSKAEALGIRLANTTLLSGLSGTGKTEFAKYVAYQMGMPLLYVNFAHCVDSLMGATAKNIVKVFEFAKTHKCILMIDEIDAIASNRSSSVTTGVDGERNRTTIALMQEFDKLPNDLIVIAATNRTDLLDEALVSRFTVQKEFLKPTADDIANLIDCFFGSLNMEVPEFDNSLYTDGLTYREVYFKLTQFLYTVLESECEEETSEPPHKQLKVSPEEYKAISEGLRSYVVTGALDGIEDGVILDIEDRTDSTKTVLHKPLKDITKFPQFSDVYILSF